MIPCWVCAALGACCLPLGAPGAFPSVGLACALLLGLVAPAGKLVREGGGGRGTPYSYNSTAKGRASVAEASRKLAEEAELLRRHAGGGSGGNGGGVHNSGVGSGEGGNNSAGNPAGGSEAQAAAPANRAGVGSDNSDNTSRRQQEQGRERQPEQEQGQPQIQQVVAA